MLYAPMKTPDQWKSLLADPERHSKEGYSAHALATRWLRSPGFPQEIAELLASNERTSAAIPLLATERSCRWRLAKASSCTSAGRKVRRYTLRVLYAVAASLALAAVMTLGDFLWAALHIRHRVANGVAHGAMMCLCLGLAVGGRVRKPVPAAAAGPVIGALGAATFYVLAPALRWGALFPAWMLLWILFALLQHWLDRRESLGLAIARGTAAALSSGVAFYLVSGMWTDERSVPGPARHFAYWTFAFLPGFLSLFLGRATKL